MMIGLLLVCFSVQSIQCFMIDRKHKLTFVCLFFPSRLLFDTLGVEPV